MGQHVVFIASLLHSGSTVLDLLMGGHPRFVGLGEIAHVLQPGPKGLEKTSRLLCSCNAKMDNCIFWGKVASELRRNANLGAEARYQIVLDTFEKVFGRDRTPVDSSKYLRPLQAIRRNPHVTDLKVLFVIKDVRAFAVSRLDRAKGKGGQLKNRIPAYHFLSWYFRNKRIKNFLRKEKIPHLQIGYEELCFSPNHMIQKICDFLGEKPDLSMLSLKDSRSHVIRGNRMRLQPDKRQGIFYDNRWFYRREWLLCALLFPNIMRFNEREVYNNGAGNIWTQ
jgi:Sulfotransferase family